MTNRLTDWLIDKLIDWLIDKLNDRLIDWLIHWLIRGKPLRADSYDYPSHYNALSNQSESVLHSRSIFRSNSISHSLIHYWFTYLWPWSLSRCPSTVPNSLPFVGGSSCATGHRWAPFRLPESVTNTAPRSESPHWPRPRWPYPNYVWPTSHLRNSAESSFDIEAVSRSNRSSICVSLRGWISFSACLARCICQCLLCICLCSSIL